MSDKEAKLAAARKRAEALKAKKAAEKVDSAKPTDNEVVNSESSPEDDDGQAEKGVIDGEGPSSDHEELKKEIGRLQNLLDESNTQQESLRKEMKDADSKARDGEKTLKSRTSDIEASLSRRDDQVHSLELEISKLRQERENHEASVKEESAKYRQLEQEKEELTKRLSNDDASDDLKKKLESALNLQASADEKVQTLEVQLSEANATADTLRDQIAKLETKHSSSTGEHQTRTRELQTKTNALQTENDSLLSQLAELRTHLISIQDEKFALAETIERLQKELKESKTNKGGYRSSIDSSRTRVSRDFDRSVSLQEIPLEDNTTSRHPQKIPLELKSNIQIDLTSWYDKHAGEVIEV